MDLHEYVTDDGTRWFWNTARFDTHLAQHKPLGVIRTLPRVLTDYGPLRRVADVKKIEELRAEVYNLREQAYGSLDAAEKITALEAEIERLKQGYGREIMDAEEQLALALGMEEHPEYGYPTGDHTVVSLAMTVRDRVIELEIEVARLKGVDLTLPVDRDAVMALASRLYGKTATLDDFQTASNYLAFLLGSMVGGDRKIAELEAKNQRLQEELIQFKQVLDDAYHKYKDRELGNDPELWESLAQMARGEGRVIDPKEFDAQPTD